MSTKFIGLALGAIALLGQGCGGAPTTPPSTATSQPTPAEVSIEKASIEIKEGGVYEPAELTVKSGTAVTWVNKGKTKVWPASAVHPVHNVCPGFDASKGLGEGESYTFTFVERKACPYHDHLNAAGPKGKIIVE